MARPRKTAQEPQKAQNAAEQNGTEQKATKPTKGRNTKNDSIQAEERNIKANKIKSCKTIKGVTDNQPASVHGEESNFAPARSTTPRPEAHFTGAAERSDQDGSALYASETLENAAKIDDSNSLTSSSRSDESGSNRLVDAQKKGLRKRKDMPQSRAGLIVTDDDRRLVSGLLREALREYKQPRVTSDEELAQRFEDYFNRCAESGQIPTVEELCLSTGFGNKYIWDIQAGRRKGFSDSTAEIIQKAKDFLQTFDAKLVVTGKLNFLAYCFRAKNYYGMRDRVDYTVTPSTQDDENFNAEELAKRYMTDARIETTFADD